MKSKQAVCDNKQQLPHDDHVPLKREQRRMLVQAMGVLNTWALKDKLWQAPLTQQPIMKDCYTSRKDFQRFACLTSRIRQRSACRYELSVLNLAHVLRGSACAKRRSLKTNKNT
eukprot:5103933-Amphidinium_carterae.1